MTDTRRIRLTERLILEVMDRCGPRRDELVVGLVGLQGLRPRQLGRLRGGDVDLRGERLVLVRPDADDVLPRRAGDVDEVDLHPHLTRVLRGYLRHDRNAPRGAADALLPARPGAAEAITPDIVNHVVRKVSREVRGLVGADFTVADLRWSCAVNLHEQGNPPGWIAGLLGHANAAETLRFIERGFD